MPYPAPPSLMVPSPPKLLCLDVFLDMEFPSLPFSFIKIHKPPMLTPFSPSLKSKFALGNNLAIYDFFLTSRHTSVRPIAFLPVPLAPALIAQAHLFLRLRLLLRFPPSPPITPRAKDSECHTFRVSRPPQILSIPYTPIFENLVLPVVV